MTRRRVQSKPMPPCGFTTKATVVNVVDGDTLDVEIVRRMRVRLDGCWAPEKHETGRPGEKARGLAAADYMREVLQEHGPGVVLFIKANEDEDLSGVLTLNRFVGSIFFPDGRELAAEMIAAGHAERTKEDLLESLRKGQTP